MSNDGQLIASGLPVAGLLGRIEPSMWEEITVRQDWPGSPHKQTQSIYLRWCSSWTPSAIFWSTDAVDYPGSERLLPDAEDCVSDICRRVGGSELGRVVLTRMAANADIMPHVDEGRYADIYDRFHLCLRGESAMLVGNSAFLMKPGELWWINHKRMHSVSNANAERIHLIADFVSPWKAKRGMCFQAERIELLWPELIPLAKAHAYEVAHYKDIAMLPDFMAYEQAENAGKLRVFTARHNGKLVGYCIHSCGPAAHYAGSTQAIEDVIYLDPQFRKCGAGRDLVRFVDERLKTERVQVVLRHVKAKPELDYSRMLEVEGYELVDRIYAKRLDR